MQDKSKNDADKEERSNEEPGQEFDAATSLREARETLGITVDEVAHELRLSREVVLALEAGDYEALGASVFVRGHLRSYARLLELPESTVASAYKPYEPEPEEFRTLSAHTVVKPGASLPNFILWALLVFLLLVGAGYLLLGDDGNSGDGSGLEDQSANFSEPGLIGSEEMPVAEPAGETISAPVPDADMPTAIAAAERTGSTFVTETDEAEVPIVEEPIVIDVPEVIEQPVAEEIAPAILTLRFTEECWVEISDSQRRLLYGLEKSGSEVELQGTPPFKLFIGNIEAVDITVAGRPYTIPQSGLRGGNTARFSIAIDSFL